MKISLTKIGAAQISRPEVRHTKIGPTKVGPGEIHLAKIDPLEVNKGEIKTPYITMLLSPSIPLLSSLDDKIKECFIYHPSFPFLPRTSLFAILSESIPDRALDHWRETIWERCCS